MTEHYHKQTKDVHLDNARIILTSDFYNGQRLDTHVEMEADFWIAGDKIDEFTKALEELIKKYRI